MCVLCAGKPEKGGACRLQYRSDFKFEVEPPFVQRGRSRVDTGVKPEHWLGLGLGLGLDTEVKPEHGLGLALGLGTGVKPERGRWGEHRE